MFTIPKSGSHQNHQQHRQRQRHSHAEVQIVGAQFPYLLHRHHNRLERQQQREITGSADFVDSISSTSGADEVDLDGDVDPNRRVIGYASSRRATQSNSRNRGRSRSRTIGYHHLSPRLHHHHHQCYDWK